MSEPLSEPTLRRARNWEADAPVEPVLEPAEQLVEEPEAETLVALPKRAPQLELDPRLLGAYGAPSPLAAQGYGFVSSTAVAPPARGSQTEAPSRSARSSSTRKRVKLRNGLPFVAPSTSRPAVPLVNGLPFVPTPWSGPLASGPLSHAPVSSGSSWATGSASVSQPIPLQPLSDRARQAMLPSYPPVPSPLPLPARPSEIDWNESQDEQRPRRFDTGPTPDGLPPKPQARRSWTERIVAAIDLPLWAVALVGTSVVVVTFTVAFALLLDSQAPPRVLVASLPRPSVAAGDLSDLMDGSGTLRITSSQRGVSAEVDGVDRGTLPLTMEKMDAGEHQLRLHGEGYVEQTRTITVESGRTLHLADVKLLPEVGATALADPPDSSALDAQRQARAEALRAAAEKQRERANELAEAKRDAADKKKAADDKRAADKKKADEKKKAKASEAAVSGMGVVNINSLPSSKAMVDGVVVGNTPVMGLSLPAGPHSVVFVHPKYGKASVGVNVQPGKTAVASHRYPFKQD